MRVQNPFDIIPEKFYNPLSGRNRKFYADVMLTINSRIMEGLEFDITRGDIYSDITLNLMKYNGQLADEVEEDSPYPDLAVTVTRERAYRRLVHCGWLTEEDDENGKEKIVSVPQYAMEHMAMLDRIAEPTEIYLGGFAKSILENLREISDNAKTFQDYFINVIEAYRGIMRETRRIPMYLKNMLQQMIDCEEPGKAADLLREYYEESTGKSIYKLLVEEGITPGLRKEISGELERIRVDDSSVCLRESPGRGNSRFATAPLPVRRWRRKGKGNRQQSICAVT